MTTDAGSDGTTAPRVRIFESYGWRDATDVALQLRQSLQEAGYDVWIDREQLREDDKFFSIALEKALGGCDLVVALLSPHSVRGQGEQDDRVSICYNEIRVAEALVKPIVPVRVSKFSGPPPFLLIKYRRIDLVGWDRPEIYRKGVAEVVETIARVLDSDKNLDADVSFQATNFAAQLRTARETFVGRGWLFARLQAWLAGPLGCLLIEGPAGSGKTAIVAELVRRNPGGRILAYHFCTPISVTLDPTAFVKSVAGMLASSIDAFGEQLWNGKLARWLSASDAQTMLSQGVLAPLHSIPMDGTYYLLVDALDEAIDRVGGETRQLTIPDLLAACLPEFPSWLKLVVTTRPQARIERLFRASDKCLLDDDSEEQRVDLREYLERRLAEEKLLAIMGPDEAARQIAIGLIEERSAGNFQFADGVVEALASGEIGPDQLKRLPARLGGLYYVRARRRFPEPAHYKSAATVLAVLLAAREPLTAGQLAAVTGLEQAEVEAVLGPLNCFVTPDFAPGHVEAYRPIHKSMTEWLLSVDAGEYRIDPAPGRKALLSYCRNWNGNDDPYCLKHLVAHLLEEGAATEAFGALREGLFARRSARLAEPRLDLEDSRNLTLALVAARNRSAIVELSTTENIWQRDGVAGALQAVGPDDEVFVDEVVGALLDAGA